MPVKFRLFLQADGSWQHCRDLEFGRDYTLGRSRSSDIVVIDEHCSRTHLKFFAVGKAWFVEEQDASNPTFIENERVRDPRRLNIGDVISIGNQTLILFTDSDVVERGHISSLLHHIKHDDGVTRATAEQDLVEYYFQQLYALAKRRSNGLDGRAEDAEDAVVSAWASFFQAMENGRLQQLENRTDLWKVLATFTIRKVIRQRDRQNAKKRDSKRTVTDSALSGPGKSDEVHHPGIEGVADAALNHELEVAFQECVQTFLDQLDEHLLEVVEMSLSGMSNQEISQRLNCSERTIKRRIAEVRKLWDQFDSGQDA